MQHAGLCQRIKNSLRPLISAMFKRQKLDGSSINMPESELDKSPTKNRKSRSPYGKKVAGSVSIDTKVEYLTTPIKSLSDTKEYQVIKLPNGLIATLISDSKNLIELEQSEDECSNSIANNDEFEPRAESSESESELETDSEAEGEEKKGPQEKLAACALSVEVGSFSDPEDIQGLSHFLEHMVFMGSEKYPKENEFDSFIRRHGGSDNAFTECQYTTYHFECPEKYLFKAMDIFSQFFITPLLKWDAINREREAIESEFQEAFPHDRYRKDQLLCSFATKDNPARKFTWGSQYTLRDNIADKHLYNSVKEYRKKHYSADRMKLAVQGRLPLPLLEKWVVECFSKVPQVPNNADIFKPIKEPFDMNKFCRFYYVSSVKDLTEIELRWVLPPVIRRYKTKPLNYLSFIIGHEGKGSLLSYLKKKLWALGLRAGHADDGLNMNDIYTIFAISITLTDEGRGAIEDVLTSTFSYLRMLKENIPSQRLFEEVQSLANTGFRFQEETSAADNVENLSQCMVVFPPEDYLRGDELYLEYDPEEIKSFLAQTMPSNVNIMLFSKNHGVQLDQEEFWFKTKYKSEPIPEKWLEMWCNVDSINEFQLPEKNQFISTDFTMVEQSKVPKYPLKVKDTDLVEIWYKGDDKFLLPIASIDLFIVTPKMLQSAEMSVYVDMFIKLLHHHLIEDLYHAMAADLEYKILSRERGIQIGVYGYNQHLDLLVDRIAHGINQFNEMAEESVLEAFKKLFARSYYNDTLKAGTLAKDIRISAYVNPHFPSSQKYRHVNSVTLSSLKEFVDCFFEQVHFQALVQGNISSAAGERIVDQFIQTVGPKTSLHSDLFPKGRVKILPKGEKCIRLSSFNLDDKNCETTVYFQHGPGTISEYVALELFVMIMEEPLFDQLRTQQQLGYDVSATVRENEGVLGVSVTVSSQIHKFTVDHVKSRIDEFVYGFVRSFPEISDEDFRDSQNSLISLKSCVDTYLKQETKRHFEEIKRQEFVFDRFEKEINFISQLEKSSVTDLVKKVISPDDSDHKKLVVQVVGHHSPSKDNVVTLGAGQDEMDVREHTLPDDIVYNFLTSDGFPQGYFLTDLNNWKNSLLEYPPHKLVE